ncbi:MAG: ADP-glyceromanno-heptose 6-epimerase [Oligoflexia bacterium]|nr:ADP-glyceromanno-heptose 6-epimerase [Oligoflexia bacterium]
MYVVTGGAGFIGSAFAWRLNREGIDDILIVDDLGESEKWSNLTPLRYTDYMHKHSFLEALSTNHFGDQIDAIVHMGACSSTTENDMDYLITNNVRYSQKLATYAAEKKIRFIYASSAATYGLGAEGFSDDPAKIKSLYPINRYGYSKQLFDLWALRTGILDHAVGLKFFNVYGPNEYHKGDMRSVVLKARNQIKEVGKVRLFKSNSPQFKDGEQMRDFVYVKDCVDVMWWLLQYRKVNGLYNLGSGKARSWKDLVTAVFKALGKKPLIEFAEMPKELSSQYQNFTEADMSRLSKAGCKVDFTSLEDGVSDYVLNYLEKAEPHLKQ